MIYQQFLPNVLVTALADHFGMGKKRHLPQIIWKASIIWIPEADKDNTEKEKKCQLSLMQS